MLAPDDREVLAIWAAEVSIRLRETEAGGPEVRESAAKIAHAAAFCSASWKIAE